jgi:hypothetical protein
MAGEMPPALLSGGPDGKFGVDPSSFTVTNASQAKDNPDAVR